MKLIKCNNEKEYTDCVNLLINNGYDWLEGRKVPYSYPIYIGIENKQFPNIMDLINDGEIKFFSKLKIIEYQKYMGWDDRMKKSEEEKERIDKLLEISDEKLNRLRKKIKPVFSHEGELYYALTKDPRKTSYNFDLQLGKKTKDVDKKPYKTIKTYHKYGYYGFFKPSEAEVVAQIPKEDINCCVAYEIITPDSRNFLTEYQNFQVAETKLYRNLRIEKLKRILK